MTKLGISSSRVYAALEKLESEGYISKIYIDKKQYFQANSPDFLLTHIDNLKEETHALISALEKEKAPEPEEYTVLYRGVTGFKQVYRQFGKMNEETRNCSEKGEYLVIEFSDEVQISGTVRNTILELTKQREELKIPMRILINEELRATYGKLREREAHMEARYLPKEDKTAHAISIYKDYVSNLVWDHEEPKVYLIKNQKIAQTYRQLFENMWRHAFR